MRSVWRTPDTLATLDRGTLRDIALVCLADAIVGVSFGAIAVSGGLRPWLPVTMSLLVFAGGAQFAAVGVVLAGGSPVAAVVAGLVLNARLLPYSFAVADVLDGSWRTRLAGAHVITDESVAFALRRSSGDRRAAFWACGLALFAAWNLAVVLGALAGAAIGNTAAFGLDAAFPTVALALVLPSLADRGTRHAAVLGAVLAVASTPFLPIGLPVLIALAGLVLAARVPPAAQPAPADQTDQATGPIAQTGQTTPQTTATGQTAQTGQTPQAAGPMAQTGQTPQTGQTRPAGQTAPTGQTAPADQTTPQTSPAERTARIARRPAPEKC
jgi:4-azaleucine resistance transporter AzlC